MDYKAILSAASILIQVSAYLVYFFGVYKGTTKPHAFTWLVWGILSTIGFFAALTTDGYAVASVLGINVVGCIITSIIGFYQNRIEYDKYDWLALIGAFVGIILWQITHTPLYAVFLISLSDMIGIVPTIRKAYVLPHEENLGSFVIGIFYYVLAISALESFELTNWFYPAAIVFSDLALILVIIVRRKRISSLVK
ncbi:MAG: hypothetical protein KBD55_03295 [Candidatus Pacebacteria bacterium]|jgi:hypothetical protein|nr:hypothetical protein [Candidatus Paceibacterota bacterium]